MSCTLSCITACVSMLQHCSMSLLQHGITSDMADTVLCPACLCAVAVLAALGPLRAGRIRYCDCCTTPPSTPPPPPAQICQCNRASVRHCRIVHSNNIRPLTVHSTPQRPANHCYGKCLLDVVMIASIIQCHGPAVGVTLVCMTL